MMTKIEELWRDALLQAKSKPIEANGFRLTRMAPDSRFDIYAGVDASSFVLLAIGTNARPPNIAMDSSSLDYFRQERADGSWVMVLRLRQIGLETVFGRLCQDLVDAAEDIADERSLVMFFGDRLSLWKKLFHHSGSGFLKPHEIKGLIAELLVLEMLIRNGNLEAHGTISGWMGPVGADQDFIYSDSAIEVKAVGPGVEAVSISSLEQLASAVPITLVIVTLRQATPGEAGSIGLNALAAKIEGMIAKSPDALKIFKERLLEAGYVEHEFYETILYEPMAMSGYAVTESFPRLARELVPSGIVDASYSIAIGSIGEFASELPK